MGATAANVRAEDLISNELARASAGVLLPDAAIVAAHVLVHGFVQHARAPHAYSPLKVFADLADLEALGHRDLERAARFTTAALAPEDVLAALAVTRALGRGDLNEAQRGRGGPLLRHALASQLDARYALFLRLRGLVFPGLTPLDLSSAHALRAVRELWLRARASRRNA